MSQFHKADKTLQEMENSLTVYASLAKLINQTRNKFDEIQLKPDKDYGMWITDARPCRRSLVKQDHRKKCFRKVSVETPGPFY